MRFRRPLAVLAVAALSLTACGGGDDPSSDPSASATAEAGASAEVGDGVAAVVNGTEIPSEVLEARVATAAETPEVADLLAGEQGELLRDQLEASVLSQLILNRIVTQGADEMGLEIDEDAVADTRADLVEQSGSEEAFGEEVAAAGLDDEQLSAELEAITAMRLVREELGAAEDTEAATEGDTPEDAASQGDAALQQWLVERLQAAEVTVDPEIGTWSAEQGQVIPAGVPQQAPQGGLPAPAPGGSEADAGTTAPDAGTTAEPTEPAASEEG